MKIINAKRGRFRCAAAILTAVLVAACDDEAETVRRNEPVAASDAETAAPAWLALDDPVAPEVWMASRAAGRTLDGDDAEVADYGRLLREAAARFNETPRMIANRTVQLEAMLAERGIDESTRVLVAGFLDRPAGAVRGDYGALCQHYFNLRATGVDRDAALAALAAAPPAGP